MGLFDIVGDIFGGSSGSTTTTTSTEAKPMDRPGDYDRLWAEFMGEYLGADSSELARVNRKIQDMERTPWGPIFGRDKYDKLLRRREELQSGAGSGGYRDMLERATGEERQANEAFLSNLESLGAPYISGMEEAYGQHSGLLSDIIGRRMEGGEVGPYAADIDKLLGERSGVSFGGGEPMQFITGAQQRLLGDLLGAQETALGNIQGSSRDRVSADMAPIIQEMALGRELGQERRDRFMPSDQAGISYLSNLFKMLEPMEMTRYHATPSTTSTGTASGTPSTGGTLGNLGSLLSLGTSIAGLF